jgi:hypothetical protein
VARQDEGERAGPERFSQIARATAGDDMVKRAGGVRKMADQRVELRAAFGRVYGSDRCGIGRIGTKTINGFGGEGDEITVAQERRGVSDAGGIVTQGFGHVSSWVVSTASGRSRATSGLCSRRLIRVASSSA